MRRVVGVLLALVVGVLGMVPGVADASGTGDPVGNLESVGSSAGGVRVVGWAFDSDAPAQPVGVHVYADGVGIGVGKADGSRPDVGAAFPGVGPSHGFDVAVPLGAGSHVVCVYAINASGTAGGNMTLGCRPVVVPGRAPIGNLESVTTGLGRYNGGTYTVFGWAADPDATSPLLVQLYVDGVYAGGAYTSDARPDVASAYPWAGGSTGFHYSFWDSGPHTVCAYGINVGAAAPNTTLGCLRWSADTEPAGNPVGALDAVTPAPGLVRVRGWAADPDAPGTGVPLRVYEDGAPVAEVVTGQPRPDVAAVFPWVGGSSGFELALPARPGAHQYCVYAGNVGRHGSGNPTLGCVGTTVDAGPVPGPHDPLGNFEATTWQCSIGTPPCRSVVLTGWAFDPDGSAPLTVVVRLRNADPLGNPDVGLTYRVTLDSTTTSLPRADVQAVYPAAGPSSGWSLHHGFGGKYESSTLICAYAQGVGAGTAETFLGCRP